MQPVCEITDTDFARCAEYVIAMQRRSDASGYNHANARRRTPEQRLHDDVNGHCGQIAFCHWLGIDWRPDANAFAAIPKVGGIFEIRTTTREHGRLIIRSHENAGDRCYVLITGNAWHVPRLMTLRGYIWGRDACHDDYLDNPHGSRVSWFVPQHALRQLDDDTRGRMAGYCGST